MIHLNTKPKLNNRTRGLARKEASKRKEQLFEVNSEDVKNFNQVERYYKHRVILFDNAELAPRGHTPNSPIIDIIKSLSANGCEVYVNCKDGDICAEILNKTACNLIRSDNK